MSPRRHVIYVNYTVVVVVVCYFICAAPVVVGLCIIRSPSSLPLPAVHYAAGLLLERGREEDLNRQRGHHNLRPPVLRTGTFAFAFVHPCRVSCIDIVGVAGTRASFSELNRPPLVSAGRAFCLGARFSTKADRISNNAIRSTLMWPPSSSSSSRPRLSRVQFGCHTREQK